MSTDSFKPTSPKSSNLSVTIAVVCGMLALFGSLIIVGIIFDVYAEVIKHMSVSQTIDWLNNSIIAQFINVLLAYSMTLVAVYFFLKKTKVKPLSIGLRKFHLSDPVFGLMALPAYFVIYLAVLNIATKLAPGLNVGEKQQIGFNNPSGVANIVLAFISLVILPPIVEEIIFRGLIFTNLRKKMHFWGAAILTSLLFAVGHLAEGGSGGILYVAGIDTFCLSMVLVYLREKTGGLYAGMTLHGLKNLIAFIALFALKQL